MRISGFEPFAGQHCETTAAGCLLKHQGLDLPEALLFGLGEGLGFIYWEQRGAPPFLGGRIKPGRLTANLARNLGLALERRETASARVAWDNVRRWIDAGRPVGLQLDSYYLDYFSAKVHFAGHFVAMHGYDEERAYLVDTAQQGGAVSVGLASLAAARGAKGPMSAPNAAFTLGAPSDRPDLAAAVRRAARANAEDFLAAPIANLGPRGIAKAGLLLKDWLRRGDEGLGELALIAALMERGGTGGAFFRNLYRDFLAAGLALGDDPQLAAGWERYARIAPLWSEAAALLARAAATGAQAPLDQAAALFAELAPLEREAMEGLAGVRAAPPAA